MFLISFILCPTMTWITFKKENVLYKTCDFDTAQSTVANLQRVGCEKFN